MTLVPLVLDLVGGTLNPVVSGSASLTPSVQLTDPGTGIAVTSGPTVTFRPGSPTPLTWILPTDVSGWAPSGWGWDIAFASNTPGSPAAYSFKIPGTGYLFSFAATSASPAVFTAEGSSLTDGEVVALAPGSSLPGGFRSNQVYYATDVSGDTFSLAATQGGSALASTSAGSGTVGIVQYLSSLSPQESVTSSAAYAQVNAGDLDGAGGSSADPKVSGIQGVPVSATAPTSGEVLTYNGSEWLPEAPSGSVASVFGRTGPVTAQSGDYSVGQVTGAAPLASPALTGTPTAPTQTSSDDSTKLATTAFVQTAAASAQSEAEAASLPLPSGTPTAGQVPVFSGSGYASAAQTPFGLLFVDAFGADPTGNSDSTAAFLAAQAAGGSGAYQLVMGPGTYVLGTSEDIGVFGPGQGLTGPGSALCTITYKGSGTCIQAYEESFSDGSFGGRFGGFSLNGNAAGDAAIGMSWGNLQGARCADIQISEFSGTAGLYFHNGSDAWSEEAEWTGIRLVDNASAVVFDTGSFDYSTYQFVIVAQSGQNGLLVQNNATLAGPRLEIRGNFTAGADNTATVIGIDVGNTSGGSSISGALLDVNVECDGSGTGHYTLVTGGGYSCQFTGTGIMYFRTVTVAFQGASLGTHPSVGFSGFWNDPALGLMTTGDGLTVHGGSQWRQYGSLTSAWGGTIYLEFADIQAFQLGNGSNSLAFVGALGRTRKIDLFIAQPASGAAGTMTWPSGVTWPGGTAPSLSTANGAVDHVRLTYVPAASAWYGELIGNAASFTGAVPVASGGTGATSAAGARSNLGAVATSAVGAAGGVASLDSSGNVPAAELGNVSSASPEWAPSDNGYLTAALDPQSFGGTAAAVAGTMYVFRLPIRSSLTLTDLCLAVEAAGSGTSTGSYVGLYSASGGTASLLSGSSDIGTLLASETGSVPCPLTTPQALPAGFVYGVFLINMPTMPTLYEAASVYGAMLNIGLASTAPRIGTKASQGTSLPSSFSLSGLSIPYGAFFMGGK
jgi:hypothetical protein